MGLRIAASRLGRSDTDPCTMAPCEEAAEKHGSWVGYGDARSFLTGSVRGQVLSIDTILMAWLTCGTSYKYFDFYAPCSKAITRS